MAVQTNKYKVLFYHKILPTEELVESYGVSLPFGEERRCTLAKLFDSKGELVYQYAAVCSLSDNFNRAFGRKMSLQGVLSGINNKSERSEIWNEYFKQFQG